MEELSATLSIEKTLLTDIRERPAHFLGFEISTYKTKKIGNYKRKNKKGKIENIKAIVAGSKVFLMPDRQRQIERLHMKGYCNKVGFPKEIGYLTNLDDFTIIERFNSVLMGLALYYCEFVRNPKKDLARWVYILRYSCLKTIAQKHKMSIRKVFKNYIAPKSRKQKSKEHTIQVDVKNIIDGQIYIKTWRLHTLETLVKKALSLKRKVELNDIRQTLNNLIPVDYKDKEKHNITNDNFYDKIMWINIRTQSSFDLPCSICGSEEDIEMHHIKHVRKNSYATIAEDKTSMQAMSIRNRKQIPVCRHCHINVIHRGKYGKIKLATVCPRIMYDNRIITIESHINKQAFKTLKNTNIGKILTKRGWKEAN